MNLAQEGRFYTRTDVYLTKKARDEEVADRLGRQV